MEEKTTYTTEELPAAFGIDFFNADHARIVRRAADLCFEMLDCCEYGSLEHSVFSAMGAALVRSLVMEAEQNAN